jgi:hypothetical protein
MRRTGEKGEIESKVNLMCRDRPWKAEVNKSQKEVERCIYA